MALNLKTLKLEPVAEENDKQQSTPLPTAVCILRTMDLEETVSII